MPTTSNTPVCPQNRSVRIGALIEVFQDPEFETISEGWAFVWAISDEDESFFYLTVSFMRDPKRHRVLRKLRKTTSI